jgi:AcrR family transcriptional regulator
MHGSRAPRYAEILDVAENVFRTRGVAPTELGDIAALAGVTIEEMRTYFAEKDDLFLATSIRVIRDYTDSIRAAVANCEGMSGLEEFRIMMRTCALFASERPGFHVGLGDVGLSYPVDSERPQFSEYISVMNEIVTFCKGAFIRGQEDGSVRRDLHVDELAVQIWGSLLGVLKVHADVARSRVRPRGVNLELLNAIDLLVDSVGA